MGMENFAGVVGKMGDQQGENRLLDVEKFQSAEDRGQREKEGKQVTKKDPISTFGKICEWGE